MMAQAVTGTPGHVNAMAESVAHFMEEIGLQNMFGGDVYITNDPVEGHWPSARFHGCNAVFSEWCAGWVLCLTAHVVDVGGRGFGPDANEVYEEAFCCRS